MGLETKTKTQNPSAVMSQNAPTDLRIPRAHAEAQGLLVPGDLQGPPVRKVEDEKKFRCHRRVRKNKIELALQAVSPVAVGEGVVA